MTFGHIVPLPLNIVWLIGFSVIVVVAFLHQRKRYVGHDDDYHRHLRRSNWAAFIRHIALVITVFIIGLTPQIPHEDSQVTSSAQVFFFVDRTGSMSALDYGGDGVDYGGQPASQSPQQRFNGVRRDVHELIEDMGPVQVSIITCEGAAGQVLPLTPDINAALAWVDYSQVETTYESRGSSLSRSFPALQDAITHAAKAHPQASRVLFVFSDGEDTTDDNTHPDWASLSPYLNGGAVFMYGTTTGATMPTNPDDPNIDPAHPQQMIPDPQTGQPGISKADPAALKHLASQLNIPFIDRNDGTTLGPFVDGLKSGADGDILAEKPVTVQRDFILPFVGILVIVTGFEVAAAIGRWRTLRRAHVFSR